MRALQQVGFALGLTLIILAAGVYRYFDQWRHQPLMLKQAFVLELQAGNNLLDMVAQLAAQPRDAGQRHPGVSRRLWLILAQVENAAHRLQAGEYLVEPGLSPQQLLTLLQQGQVIQHEFRIVEGATVVQLLQKIAAEPRLQHQVKALDQQQLAAELALPTAFSEGQFFPDTYLFARHSSDIDILRRAHLAMQQHLAVSWQQRHPQLALSGPDEALILASIIEKESGLSGDRTTISQVFHNRLRHHMRLQADPTVIYGVGEMFDGNLTRKHLREDTPYNTYTRSGLPPTPIALPSKRSLLAATQPSSGNFLYFVARGDGSSQFSATLAEHNKAVRQYQLQGGG